MPFLIAALLANLCFAVADNANGLASKHSSSLRMNFWSALIASVVFLIPLVIFFQSELARLTWISAAWIVGTGVLITAGYWAFIAGMRRGSVVVTGVIGGAFPAMTTIVALFLFKEPVSALQLLTIVVILIGIGLSSMSNNLSQFWLELKTSALIYPILTFLLWGIYFALVRIPIEQVGWFLPQYGANLVALPLVIGAAYVSRDREYAHRPPLLWLVGLAAVLQVSGSFLFNFGISQGPTSIVAPIAGSSPAVFVILAFFIFKEKLSRTQQLGIGLTVVGIIGLSLLSS